MHSIMYYLFQLRVDCSLYCDKRHGFVDYLKYKNIEINKLLQNTGVWSKFRVECARLEIFGVLI